MATKYYVEWKDGPRAKFRRLTYGYRLHDTEEAAWAQVAGYDQDGFIDRIQYRVIATEDE